MRKLHACLMGAKIAVLAMTPTIAADTEVTIVVNEELEVIELCMASQSNIDRVILQKVSEALTGLDAHDLLVVCDFAGRMIVMQGGRIVEQGSVLQIFEAAQETYTRNLPAASLDPDRDVQASRRAAREELELTE
jgi:ABC-type microcin C transport system duplicated ATPase subunit YejF